MSLLQSWNSGLNLNRCPNSNVLVSNYSNYRCNLSCLTKPRKQSVNTNRGSRFTCLLKLGAEDIADIFHNQVIIAAGVSGAIGQLAKPFTGVLLYGRDFDYKAAFQAGGFPSSHSSAVVATAISLALERGFSDPIFGLSLVYAGLVMYDSQGVRREVGTHAKVLNKWLPKTQAKPMLAKDKDDYEENPASFLSKEGRSFVPNSNEPPLLLETRQTSQKMVLPSAEEGKEKVVDSFLPLKESIGHTEFEVIAGALLGLFVGIAVHNVI
ncbi:hypothetical protein Tsubulata_022043 [Turnera subulata]|uniref:Uncharacterized protein n=1 Tax=Turnera subulata TaxID=218843 RepID=A0A9Q0FST1_9ROSI|nr:hypothetical protein Tsubulata_022043 [Turnera subulata]